MEVCNSPYFILVGKNPVQISMDQHLYWWIWHEWMTRTGGLCVARYKVPQRNLFGKGGKMLSKINHFRKQKVVVSTVFLGIDSKIGSPSEGMLFETFVSGGIYHGLVRRYRTWEQAKSNHEIVASMVTSGIVK